VGGPGSAEGIFPQRRTAAPHLLDDELRVDRIEPNAARILSGPLTVSGDAHDGCFCWQREVVDGSDQLDGRWSFARAAGIRASARADRLRTVDYGRRNRAPVNKTPAWRRWFRKVKARGAADLRARQLPVAAAILREKERDFGEKPGGGHGWRLIAARAESCTVPCAESARGPSLTR